MSRPALVVAALSACIAGLSAQPRYAVQREETISRTLRFARSPSAVETRGPSAVEARGPSAVETRGPSASEGGNDRLLEVSTINGSIRVAAHEGDSVDAVVRRTVRAETDADADAAETAAVLEMTEAAGAIGLRGQADLQPGCDWETVTRRRSRPRYQVAYTFDVRVPRGTRLRLCTVNGGEVHVAGTAGAFEIDNVNGSITLSGVGGSGRATTVNGPVSVTFAENPKSRTQFKSVNGDLDVVFQPEASADLLMKTFNGGLFTDFDVTPLPTPVAVVERRNGMSVYRGNRFTAYRVGRGGPEVTLETFNGNIRVVGSR